MQRLVFFGNLRNVSNHVDEKVFATFVLKPTQVQIYVKESIVQNTVLSASKMVKLHSYLGLYKSKSSKIGRAHV